MTEPTFRCGWRCQRNGEPLRPDLYQGAVLVRRGEFRIWMPAESFDAMADTDFAAWIRELYRDAVFEQLEADLAVLARQLLGEMEQREGLLIVDGVSFDGVQAALYRYTTAERDRREPTS